MEFDKLTSENALLLKTIQGVFVQLSGDGRILVLHCLLEDCDRLAHLQPLGDRWYDLFEAMEGQPSSREFFDQLLLTGGHGRHLNWVTDANGTPLYLEWQFQRMEAPGDDSPYLIGVGRAMSQRMANEERLMAEHHRLVERDKVMTCLYGISQIIVEVGRSFDDKLASIAQLLLPALRYPRRASVHILLDGVSYKTPGFEEADKRITEQVIVRGEERGCVEVGYRLHHPPADRKKVDFNEKEHQLLIDVARQLAFKLEKREMQDQLMHADRLVSVGELAAGIAHELNNPLTDILGFAQLASRRPDLPDDTYQDLVRIVKSSLYAREVIKKILLFSRQSHPMQTEVDLNAIVAEWLDFIEFRCAKNDIEVTLDLQPDLPSIIGDSAQLNQVLVNLVVNAIHAMPQGGQLTIRTGSDGNTVYLSVRDDGAGIRREIFDKIFLPFFTTKEVDQGTGLGLAVVYGIVEEHDGKVSVQSKEGEGSVFRITLPRHKASH